MGMTEHNVFGSFPYNESTYRDYLDDVYSGSLWRGTHLKQKKRENMRFIIIIERRDVIRDVVR